MRVFGIEFYLSSGHSEPLLHCAAYKVDSGWMGIELASLRLEVSWNPSRPITLSSRDITRALNTLALVYLAHWNIL